MRQTVGTLVERLGDTMRQDAERALRDHGDGGVVDPAAALTEDQVLGEWWPIRDPSRYPSAATKASALRPFAMAAERPSQCTPPTRAKAWLALG